MRLRINKEDDALYLRLDEAPVVDSEEVSPGIILDYDADGRVVGIEMLNLSSHTSAEEISRFQLETA